MQSVGDALSRSRSLALSPLSSLSPLTFLALAIPISAIESARDAEDTLHTYLLSRRHLWVFRWPRIYIFAVDTIDLQRRPEPRGLLRPEAKATVLWEGRH